MGVGVGVRVWVWVWVGVRAPVADVELVEVRHHVCEVDHRQALGIDRVEHSLLEE